MLQAPSLFGERTGWQPARHLLQRRFQGTPISSRAWTGRQPRLSSRVRRPQAMVNVDFSPSVVLGMGLIGSGLALYQIRRIQPDLSRDFDIIISSVAMFSGGILVFQGWRLDPLLLFCQLLTAGTAVGFALETLKLRQVMRKGQQIDSRMRAISKNDDYIEQESAYSLPQPPQEAYSVWQGAAQGDATPWQDDGYVDRSQSDTRQWYVDSASPPANYDDDFRGEEKPRRSDWSVVDQSASWRTGSRDDGLKQERSLDTGSRWDSPAPDDWD